MLDKIFKMFFVEKKKIKKTACLTVVRDSSLFNQNEILLTRTSVKNKIEGENLTCLSKYFQHIKGLNFKERELLSELNLRTIK